MILPKYDLHTHTTASDGVLSPLALYQLAAEKGVEVLAITDHDTVEGIKDLQKYLGLESVESGPRLIAGAEFTCLFEKQVLHVVGLGLNVDHVELKQHLSGLEELRLDRARRIAAKLEKKKMPNVFELVLEKAAGAQIGRPHFAKVLCDLKIVSTEADAFKKYLGAGKIGNVSVAWPSLEKVLEVITSSGAVSVLAHPTKYNLTMSKLRKVIAAFSELGGNAIELGYPGINREQQNILAFEADKHNLSVSAGSDFHTPLNRWTVVGAHPPIPDNLPHILNHRRIANTVINRGVL